MGYMIRNTPPPRSARLHGGAADGVVGEALLAHVAPAVEIATVEDHLLLEGRGELAPVGALELVPDGADDQAVGALGGVVHGVADGGAGAEFGLGVFGGDGVERADGRSEERRVGKECR